ncbi:uncharacterized protein LOC116452702 [Corvus moneduloides]|uniref:uncharacterized protein LOC116452702 n=1 Tax=Corvus moneduloides TaxID=1196302 RepID=UPI00136445EC|nr:uncharacterized protein LOC116452702 [Corvus moneduloides]
MRRSARPARHREMADRPSSRASYRLPQLPARAAEVRRGTGGLGGSGIPLCPFLGGWPGLCGRPGASPCPPARPLRHPPVPCDRLAPARPRVLSPRAPHRAPAALPWKVTRSFPGRVQAFAGRGDDSFPVRATVLTTAVQARARQSPRRRREPRAPRQAGDEGTSAACAGRPEPLPGPSGHCEGRSGAEPWGDLKLRLQLTVKKCVMWAVVWFAPPCVPLCQGRMVETYKKLSWALRGFQCSAKEDGWFCCSHAAAWDPHPSHSIHITLRQLWSFLRAVRRDEFVSCQQIEGVTFFVPWVQGM